MVGEEVWSRTATFTVEPLSQQASSDHEVVIRAAARSVSSMGGDRRRGSGWVVIRDDEVWTDSDTKCLLHVMRKEEACG